MSDELEKKLMEFERTIIFKIEALEKKLEAPIMTLDHSVAIMSINEQLAELKYKIKILNEKIEANKIRIDRFNILDYKK